MVGLAGSGAASSCFWFRDSGHVSSRDAVAAAAVVVGAADAGSVHNMPSTQTHAKLALWL